MDPTLHTVTEAVDVNVVSQVDNTAHTHRSFATRKPDVVAFNTTLRGSSNITLIGDVKGYSTNGDFPDDEVGHVLDMGTTLMELHRTRARLYCFLTDGYRFQYFSIERDRNDYLYKISGIYVGYEGWQVSI
jgi:hypothetical protein